MKAAAVDYVRARSLEEALDLLATPGVESLVMAGGQSLVAMMNLRIAAPERVIDIARLRELGEVVEDDDAVTFGACVTHAAIEDGRFADPSRGLMAKAAQTLAYRAIRTRGTLGGSLALADPAAEWPVVLAALGAQAVLRGRGGQRRVPCGDFVTGIFETRLADDEIVEAVRIPKLSGEARWGYVKLARKAGEFALALAVAVVDPVREYRAVVLGAAEGAPLPLGETSRLLGEGRCERTAARAAIAADLDAAATRHIAPFRRGLHAVAALRAIEEAQR